MTESLGSNNHRSFLINQENLSKTSLISQGFQQIPSFVNSQSNRDISFNMINFLNLAEQAEATTNQPKGRLPGLSQAKKALQHSDHATL